MTYLHQFEDGMMVYDWDINRDGRLAGKVEVEFPPCTSQQHRLDTFKRIVKFLETGNGSLPYYAKVLDYKKIGPITSVNLRTTLERQIPDRAFLFLMTSKLR